MVREILNTKKSRKLRELPNFGPKLFDCGKYSIHFEWLKKRYMLFFFLFLPALHYTI